MLLRSATCDYLVNPPTDRLFSSSSSEELSLPCFSSPASCLETSRLDSFVSERPRRASPHAPQGCFISPPRLAKRIRSQPVLASPLECPRSAVDAGRGRLWIPLSPPLLRVLRRPGPRMRSGHRSARINRQTCSFFRSTQCHDAILDLSALTTLRLPPTVFGHGFARRPSRLAGRCAPRRRPSRRHHTA